MSVVKKLFIIIFCLASGLSSLEAATATDRQLNKYDEYCSLLGVASDANEATIKRAYKKFQAKSHPDMVQRAKGTQKQIDEATELFKTGQKAYDNLEKCGFKRLNAWKIELPPEPDPEPEPYRWYPPPPGPGTAPNPFGGRGTYGGTDNKWGESYSKEREREFDNRFNDFLNNRTYENIVYSMLKPSPQFGHFSNPLMSIGLCGGSVTLFGIYLGMLKAKWEEETLNGLTPLSWAAYLKNDLMTLLPRNSVAVGKTLSQLCFVATLFSGYAFSKNFTRLEQTR